MNKNFQPEHAGEEMNIIDIVDEMNDCLEPLQKALSSLSCEEHDYEEGNGVEKDEQEEILRDMINSIEEIINCIEDSQNSQSEEEFDYYKEKIGEWYADIFDRGIDANIASDRGTEYWLDKAIEKTYAFEELVNSFYDTDFSEILELQSEFKKAEVIKSNKQK